MPLKDRFRKALSRPNDRSSSNSSISDAVPTPTEQASTPTPSISLTKTSSRLSKTLTWGTNKKSREEREEDKARKRLEDWEKKDEQEWKEPSSRRPGKKSKAHQDMLRAFEWKFREGKRASLDGEGGGRRWSVWSSVSGVSPTTSRMNSLEGVRKGSASRKWSGGGLSREVTREDEGVPAMPATVQEE